MEQIIITHKDGTTLKLNSSENVSQITKASQTVELLGADTIDISVTSAKKLKFLIGDKITIIGRDYTLNTPAKEKKISEVSFQYDLQFEGVQYDLLRAAYNVNVDTTSNEIQDLNGDSLTGDIKMFLDVLISNANRVFGTGKWSIGTYPTGTKTITLTFNDTDNCLSVLQTICGEDNFNTEFDIAIDSNGNRTINIGSVGNTFNYTFEYGKGKGIYDLTREKVSSSNIVTRLNVFGGTKNIVTTKYRASKLCLPNKSKSQSYIEDADAISKYGVWEGAKDFEDIYPSRTGTISALGDSVLKFIDSSMDFDLNAKDADGNTIYMMSGTTPKVHFNTGNLAGYEFDIKSYDATTKQFTINSQTDQNDYTFPSTTSAAFQFSVGDEYALVDLYMPQVEVINSENKLLQAGTDYLAKYSQPLVQYGLTVDKFFLKNQVSAEAESNIIWVGDYIPVKDTDIDVDKAIRVKAFTRDLLDDYSYSLTIADLPVTITTITRVIRELSQVDKVLNINNLNDPARARRNYLATTELITMIDTVKAEAALIGNDPAAQYELTGVAITANYGGNSNAIYLTAGTIAHNYYPVGNPGTWNISVGNFSGLTAATAYYLYIKASTSSSSASYYISSTKIEVESVAGYYHFPLGILSSVINGARVLQTTKGYTLICGDDIKTGRISSNDGGTYFDLSTGVFKGKFVFTNGSDVETAVSTATTNAATAQTTANSAASAASAAQTDATNALGQLTNIVSDNILSAAEKGSQRQAWNIISAEKSSLNTQASTFSITTENTAYNTAFQTLANYLNVGTTWSSGVPSWLNDSNLSINTTIVGSTYRSNWESFYTARTNLLNAISTKAKALADAAQSSVDNIQIGGANLINNSSFESDFTFDTQNIYNCTLSYPASYGWITPISGARFLFVSPVSSDLFYFGFKVNVKSNQLYTFSLHYVLAYQTDRMQISLLYNSNNESKQVQVVSGKWDRKNVQFTTPSDTTSVTIRIDVLTASHWIAVDCIQLEEGNKMSSYSISAADIQANIATAQTTANNAASAASALQYLATALQGSTDINGGLLATNVLLMKDSGGNITGGMSGLSSDNIAVWGGGTYQNALDALAKMIMRKDGSGQLASGKILWDLAGNMYVGNFAIEAGAISGYADNKNKVKFHTGTIPTLSSLVNGGIVQDLTTYSPSQTNRWVNSGIDKTYSFQNITYGSITVPANTTVYLNFPVTNFNVTNGEVSSTNQYYEFVLGSTVIGDYTSSTSQIVLSAGGTYTVKYYTNSNIYVYALSTCIVTLSTTTPGYLSYQIGVERTEIGKDGFYSYWGANSYLHFSQSGGLNFKGTMNLPGVIASASVASAGGSSNKWGPKVGDSSKSTTGTYTINHSIGHVNYNVIITGITDTGRVGCCSAKTTTSCTIKMVSLSNSLTDSNFDYVIIGSN